MRGCLTGIIKARDQKLNVYHQGKHVTAGMNEKASCRSIAYITEALTGCGHNASVTPVNVFVVILPHLTEK